MKIIKRKASLSATILLCIAIISISTYIMKWVFDRYLTVTRIYKSSVTKSQSEGVMLYRISYCGSGLAYPGGTIDGKSPTIAINCSATSATNMTVTLTED